MALEIRITHYGTQRADQFNANPLNPRIHPQHQRDVIRASLQRFGIISPVVVSKRSGYLIDGHERVWQALAEGDDTLVPYVEADVDEDKEAELILSYDKSTMLAEYDPVNVATLLDMVNTDDEVLSKLFDQMANEAGIVQADDEPLLLDFDSTEYEYVPDALYPTDNDYGVPTLDLKMQATSFELPANIWGYLKRTARVNGTWLFYTDDYRWEALWKEPLQVLRTRATAVSELNYSTNDDMPRAMVLYNIYRKRWLSRFWQSRGIKALVDLHVARRYVQDNLLGVPKGWNAFTTRAYEGITDEWLDEDFAVACEVSGNSTPLFAVYGGGKGTVEKCKRMNWIHVKGVMDHGR